MATIIKNSITISRKIVQQKGAMVILPLEEYERLKERIVPTYYLSGKEAEEADKMVEEGLKEYRAEKTKRIKSLADLD